VLRGGKVTSAMAPAPWVPPPLPVALAAPRANDDGCFGVDAHRAELQQQAMQQGTGERHHILES
jgi:hypothetical protein